MPDSYFPSVSGNPTLHDFLQALDPNDGVATLGELLHQTNKLLTDMTWQEGNLLVGHRFAVRTGLPTPTWRRLNQGVQPQKGSRAQVTASTGMLEDYGQVDKALVELNGNTAAFRMQEEAGFIEGYNQKVQEALLYESEASNPEAITGIMPHFNSLSAGTGEQIIDAGGTGSDNASILLIGWAPTSIYGIFPKGSKAGLQITDKGVQTVQALTADGTAAGMMEAYVTHYRWDLGLVVQDYRYVVRIANIDRSLLTADMSTGAKLPDLMFQALDYLPSLENCRPVFYMDRTIRTVVRQQLPNYIKGSTLTMSDAGGSRITSFPDGTPIQLVDKMRVDETRVV